MVVRGQLEFSGCWLGMLGIGSVYASRRVAVDVEPLLESNKQAH